MFLSSYYQNFLLSKAGGASKNCLRKILAFKYPIFSFYTHICLNIVVWKWSLRLAEGIVCCDHIVEQMLTVVYDESENAEI